LGIQQRKMKKLKHKTRWIYNTDDYTISVEEIISQIFNTTRLPVFILRPGYDNDYIRKLLHRNNIVSVYSRWLIKENIDIVSIVQMKILNFLKPTRIDFYKSF